ncbi:hypothetical protein CRE_25836 [Caenorhabditis remanei]|uniref:Uncharacterized protein n=1 Tax=Caenorhabditis remanei TaxID=31234 RepID=E3NA88_CAERE|nr:hypothetical protein CRE_25836 [Caenorhabditis remanei]
MWYTCRRKLTYLHVTIHYSWSPKNVMVVDQFPLFKFHHTPNKKMNRLAGHEEYQEILNYMENIAVERVGEIPASVEGRDLVDIYFNYLLEVLDNHY